MSETELYFELSIGDNYIKFIPSELKFPDAEIDWDRNWIETVIEAKGGAFTGSFKADFMTVDFEKFKQELISLYDNLKGSACFSGLEGYLQLKIKGDGLGHFEIDIEVCDKPGVYGSNLKYSMYFDQTQINGLISQLDKITKKFPITGEFKIRNH